MTTEHDHPEAPEQIVPRSLNDYLEVMTKAVFQSGLSWSGGDQQVARLPGGIQGLRCRIAVAAMSEPEIDTLAADTAIVRNRRKIVGHSA